VDLDPTVRAHVTTCAPVSPTSAPPPIASVPLPSRREIRQREQSGGRAAHVRRRRRAAVVLAAVAAVGIAVPAVAQAGGPVVGLPTATVAVERPAALPTPQRAPGTAGTTPLATVEDESTWCSYLSSHYLTFPSPWSARVINCRESRLFVAPVYSDGGLGMCVLVPARHSRHLGGNVARWVTDIRLC